MNLNRPTDLHQYLEQIGAFPNKRLSQNFLIDGNIIRKIVAFADLKPEETVLEIGPGPGALTDALLAQGASVIAVEKDPLFAEALKKREGNLKVVCGDFLETDLAELMPNKSKVIANLPYHLTTPILTRLLPQNTLLSSLIVMVQLEVAERLTASPGGKEYGSLTLFSDLYSTSKFGFKVSRNCFYPKPNVDSAVIRFDLKIPPKEVDEESFFQTTRTAFGQRRKMITSTLSKLYPKEKIVEGLKVIGFSEKARPEELSSEAFINLYRFLKSIPK